MRMQEQAFAEEDDTPDVILRDSGPGLSSQLPFAGEQHA